MRLRELVLVESFDHRRMCTLSNGTDYLVCVDAPRYMDISALDDSSAALVIALVDKLAQTEGDGRFFSPHRAYIVNLEFIQGLAGGELLLSNGRRLPVRTPPAPPASAGSPPR